jgi:hypothetical protein
MSNTQDNRVLSRKGARYLTDHELKVVCGNGTVTTFLCSYDPRGHKSDGDCD